MAFLGFALAPGSTAAADPTVKLKAVLVAKVLKFDRALTDNAKVLICGEDGEEYAAIFSRLGVVSQTVTVDELPKAVANASVVYFLDASLPAGAQKLVGQAKNLSVANFAALAESGQVTVAIDTSRGKPEIVVNLERAKIEGRDLAAALLGLARVVK